MIPIIPIALLAVAGYALYEATKGKQKPAAPPPAGKVPVEPKTAKAEPPAKKEPMETQDAKDGKGADDAE